MNMWVFGLFFAVEVAGAVAAVALGWWLGGRWHS